MKLNPGAGPANEATHVFRPNSCYDPDVTGVGHQPMYWDQWAALYNHYIVLGSKITVQASAQSSTSVAGGLYVVLHLDDDHTLSQTGTALIEQKKAKWMILTDSVQSGRQGRKLTHKYSCKKFFNVKDVKDNIDRLGANISSDPTEQVGFFLICGGMDPALNPASIDCLVTIDYIVQFSELKAMTQS